MAQLKTGLDKVKSFVDRVMEKVPEADRAALTAEFSRTHDEVATLDDLIVKVQTTAGEQKSWWDANKDKVVELDRIKSDPNFGKAPAGTGVSEADLATRIAASRDEMLSTGLALVTEATTISASHLKEFGESLDMRKLAQEAIKANKTLDTYYTELVAPKRLERDTATRADEIKKAEERGAATARAELLKTQMPYPVGGQGSAPTTLAGLKPGADGKTANPEFSLDAAVATATAVASGQR